MCRGLFPIVGLFYNESVVRVNGFESGVAAGRLEFLPCISPSRRGLDVTCDRSSLESLVLLVGAVLSAVV